MKSRARKERDLRTEVLGALMPEDQFRAAVRKAINDKLDAYFEECPVEDPRPWTITHVAEVAAEWISEEINRDNMEKLQAESDNRS